MTQLFDSSIEAVAKVVYAEGGIFVGRNYKALLAIAQCVKNLYDNGYGTLTNILDKCFNGKSDVINDECVRAVKDVFLYGVNRFANSDIIEFRSFTKYSDGYGFADFYKCAPLFQKYDFLGSDSISSQWGHLYFGFRKKFEPYMVRISIPDLNVRKEPTVDSEVTMVTGIGDFTIVDVRSGKVNTKTNGIGLWGKLLSGAGWISLDYCETI